MNTQPTTSIETPVILLTTPLEYGRQKAKECGRKRISDEMAMRYAEPCYYWEVRDLLEKKSFDFMKNLFSFFYSLYLLANNKTAKSALCCGFVYSAEKREYSNSPYFFKSDADFQNLYKMDATNINKMDAIIEYFTSQPNEPTLDELKAQYLAMPLDDLRRIKKEKYSNMDITTAMSNDEKAITEAIAIKFSELNQKIKEKRQAEKAAANQVEIIEATKEEVAHYTNNGMFENDAIEKVLASYNECLYSFGKDSFHGQQYQIGINYLKSLIEPKPTNQNETMQPQPTQLQIQQANNEYEKCFNLLKNDPLLSETYKDAIEYIQPMIDELKPQTLTVGQTIQCDGYRLVVTAIKEAKQAETQENEATIKALKKISGTKWVGNTIHDTLDKCLTAINLNSTNSGWYNPKAKRIPGLTGIYMINQDNSIFCEARIIKESAKQYRIEYLTKTGWNEFERLYCQFINDKL